MAAPVVVAVVSVRCTDDELRAIAMHSDPQVRAVAVELLAIRAERRRDSRRAEQIKRIRWVTENQLTKIEALAKRWDEELLAVEPPAADDEP